MTATLSDGATREQAEFVRRIVEQPFDDTPRLVFADWLDEHGEPERAEFIRVQVELARTDSHREDHDWDLYARAAGIKYKCLASCERCRRDSLRRRERELFETRWVAGARDSLENASVEVGGVFHWHGTRTNQIAVRRGFVAEVRCPLPLLLGGACECGIEGWAAATGESSPAITSCPACNGTRRTPGVAAELFARHPVTAVQLAGVAPVNVGTGVMWSRGRGANADFNVLPADLFDALNGFREAREPTQNRPAAKIYPAPADAHAALSRVVVAVCRERAGLPELEWPE